MDIAKLHSAQSLDTNVIMSFADDLCQVFEPARDISALAEVKQELSRLESVLEEDWSEVQTILKDVHGQVLMHEQKVEAAEKEGVDDATLHALRTELEKEQQYELQFSQELR
ncbi:hypothetical protein KI387_035592 [Taxus chinensis]|uniref:Uncharacterized protein n=1 Tax=Taxus chinensis TaxID=29808 RepID=A0AA38FNV7_TAXCH|nr:hypothetical protein KI387_035592 [Taxus chinensis]